MHKKHVDDLAWHNLMFTCIMCAVTCICICNGMSLSKSVIFTKECVEDIWFQFEIAGGSFFSFFITLSHFHFFVLSEQFLFLQSVILTAVISLFSDALSEKPKPLRVTLLLP